MRRRWHVVAVAVAFASAVPALGTEVVVSIDPTNLHQEIEGFGASLTDSSAWLLQRGIPSSLASNVLRQLFSPTNGIGLGVLRQPMGSSDFRLEDYTYDDMPAGQTDYALTNFSIRHDTNYITPLLRQVSAINTNLKIMGTPWSPPAWMKTSDDLYYGSLKTNAYGALAAYFRKYVQAYAAEGLPIHAVTLQNEPLYEPYSYAGMAMTVSNQIDLVKKLGADFATNGIATKILVYDHNWDQFNFPISVLNDASAASYIAGSAFHGYAGDVSVQTLVHDAHPTKDIYFTECSSGTWSGDFTNSLMWDVENLIIGATRHWAKTVIKWNLVLDQNGGPKMDGGCETCRGLLTIDTNTLAVTTNAEYYALAHASKFLRPGARRAAVEETASGGPYSVAFANPDTGMVAVAYNPDSTNRDFTFRCLGQSFNYRLPARSVATFTWPAVSCATVDVWITTASRTKLLEKQTNVVCMSPVALSWKGRTWTVRDSQGDPDNNLWSASCARIDTNGWLRLAAKNGAGVWYSGQVESQDSPAHGTYRWYTVGLLDQLDTNVVAGLSTYFDAFRGLDIEFAHSYEDEPTNVFYTVQPYYLEDHRYERDHSFTGTLTTHELRWTPRRAEFRSWYGHTSEPPSEAAVFAQWSYEGDDVPGDTNEHVRMNLWMFNALAPAVSQELVLADFTYQCATGAFLRDDFDDASLSNVWERCNDAGSRITESGDELRIPPADADGDSLGVRTAGDVRWDDDGLSYVFTVNLASAVVSQARAAGGADLWAYEALVAGANGIFDPASASNAATLRAGYDASADQLTVEFLTKTASPGSWGASRFLGTIDGASSLFNGSGIDLVFVLVYSNYQVSAVHGGDAVAMTTVSGSVTGAHNLGSALYAARYIAGAQNHDEGRGTVYLDYVEARADAALPSTAGGDGDGGPGTTVVQVGDGNPAYTWRAPIDCTYTRHRSMVLYKADDIGRSGSITQLWINVLSAPDIPLSNYTVRLQHSTLDAVGATFINSGWTTVHHANVTFPAGHRGWYPISFTTSFVYNVKSNLLVDFIFQNAVRDSSPSPAASYTLASYVSCYVISSGRDDPYTWTTGPSGSKYRYNGARIVDVRLAFPNEPPVPIGENLSFEDGPPGFLTNVPSWSVEGSAYAGAIKVGPAYHGSQSLKLWKNGGDGDQKLYQCFDLDVTNQYALSGYILSQSGEPFEGSNAYGALVLEWYGASGFLRADESPHFTQTNTYNVWQYLSVTSVPPSGTTSGRFACALVSSADQEGSLYFDRLDIQATPAPDGPDGTPVPSVSYLRDEFNDTSMSNCWLKAGNFLDTVYQESGGAFRIRPGTNWSWQSAGYASVGGIPWNNSNAWCVFSATLTTVSVDSVSGTNDIAILLGIVSEPENPWYVTNSVGLYGYYSSAGNYIIMQLLMKTDRPSQSGDERLNAMITNVSSYFGSTNGLRISIALGQNQYDMRFSDRLGYPVPLTLNAGSTRGLHYLGEKLTNAYWYVGAQNDAFKRGDVYWDRTEVFHTHAPSAGPMGTAQVSTDGSGIVSVTNWVSDPNGDACRLRLEASTNAGSSWFAIQAASLTSSLPASLASTQTALNVVSIQTTNGLGQLESNRVVITWDTVAAGLGGETVTNTLLRARVDDGYVGFGPTSSPPFVVDNQGPSPSGATVSIEDGAAYVVGDELSAAWNGFADSGSAIGGYYLSLADHGESTNGTWTAMASGSVTGAVPDATNAVFVWAADIHGNIGSAASDAIVALSPSGDYDADALANTGEVALGANPLDPDSDGDGITDGWEAGYGLDPCVAADAADDWDDDGYDNRREFFFDTHPSNDESCLSFEAVAADGAQCEVRWSSSTARVYSVYSCEDIGGEWAPVANATNLPGLGGTMVHTSSTEAVARRLHRLGVRFP